MIDPIQSRLPLEQGLVPNKDVPGYGPSVPEFQETIQINKRPTAGRNLNLTITAIDYDEEGKIWGSPYVLYTLYFRSTGYIGIDAPDDPDGLVVDEITIKSVGV